MGDSKKALVAWSLVCQSRSCAGLGFKELLSWNKAMLSNWLWELGNVEQSSIWKDWIKAYRLKTTSFGK